MTEVLLNFVFSVLNFLLIFFVNKYRKYLKLVASFICTSFSLCLARNNTLSQIIVGLLENSWQDLVCVTDWQCELMTRGSQPLKPLKEGSRSHETHLTDLLSTSRNLISRV